jgi:hypothetical protein
MTDNADGGGLESFVFDDNNQERRSWKFCNRTLPRSEVVFFCQFLIILLIILLCGWNLQTLHACEDKLPWIALLSSAVGYVLPNPKL